jgi:hypothetical protein
MDVEREIIPKDEFEALDAACRLVEHELLCRASGGSHRVLPATLKPKQLLLSTRLSTLRFPKMPIYYKTSAQVDELAGRLLQVAAEAAEPYKVVLGFDVEWAVSFTKGRPPGPVALMQLCIRSEVDTLNSSNGIEGIDHSQKNICTNVTSAADLDTHPPYECYLLHIRYSGIPPRLQRLLTLPTVLKTGVGIQGDACKLASDYGVSLAGIVDLGTLEDEKAQGRNGGVSFRGTHWSLATLARRVLHGHLPKPGNVRCSNWEAYPLTMEQQMYAATDAWVSLRIYEEINRAG